MSPALPRAASADPTPTRSRLRRRAHRLPGAGTLYGFVVGATLMASGLGMLVSAAVGLAGDGREVAALAIPGVLAALAGLPGVAGVLGTRGELKIRPTTGFAAVTLAWVLAAAVGALPMLLAGTFSSPLDAYFEAMSGFTTTGATLVNDIDATSDAVLTWRSITQWLGGIGIVVLVVAIAPLSGPAMQRVFYAETSGVTPERLTPRIVDTAKILVGIYAALTLAAGIAYAIAGMSVFDAFNQTMTTIATGGFGTHNNSMAAFDSLAIELVAIAFMFLAGVNFALYWRVVRGQPLMPQLAEAVAYAAIAAVAIAAVAISLELSTDVSGPAAALRESAFTVTSLITTTGYTTADFDGWNELARVVLLLLMFVGACAGSTAGGVKVIRAVLLGKATRQELNRQLQPNAVQVLRFGGRPFSEGVRNAVLGYFLLYAAVFVAGILALSACGLNLDSSIGATASTINVVGPGLGDVGAIENFAAVPPAGRVVSVVLMLVGRLELFTVVALVAAAFGAVRRTR